MTGKTHNRGNGEGSVYKVSVKRKAGTVDRWVAQVIVDGKKRRVFAATEAKAKTALRALLRDLDVGKPITSGAMTVSDLLTEWTAKALPNRHLEPATLAGHRAATKALVRDLGGVKVRDLRPEHIEAAFAKRAAAGTARATLAKSRTTLRMALAWAERRDVVSRNVAAVAELPAAARPARAGKAMAPDQARAFIAAAAGTPLEAMWLLCLYLGLRPGEAAGLAWEDVDQAHGVVHVRRGRKLGENGEAIIGAPKTSQSVRSLRAPEPVMAALRARRIAQAAERLRAGALWSNPLDLVFTSPTGRPTDPAACRREFGQVITKAGAGEGWTPNLLRHTAASLLSAAGLPIEELADQLGHKDTRMASLHYRHRMRPTVDGGDLMGKVLA